MNLMSDEIKNEVNEKPETTEEKKDINMTTEKFEELIRAKLQEQYYRGIRVGIMTVSRIVLDKLNDGSKPFMTRVQDVKKFCAVPFKNLEVASKEEQKEIEENAEPEEIAEAKETEDTEN